MVPFNFRLWVFDTVDLTDVKRQDLRALIDVNFMRPLIGGNVTSASSRVVGPNEAITPGRFDALVFLTNIAFKGSGSILKRAGVSPEEAIGNENVKGLTVARLPGGGIAEVYWNRCESLSNVAAAIFHEAGHLKFQETRRNEMHESTGPDNTKVVILASHVGNVVHPNAADINVFRSKIGNAITLRTTLP